MTIGSLSPNQQELYAQQSVKRKLCYRICGFFLVTVLLILLLTSLYQWFSIRSLKQELLDYNENLNHLTKEKHIQDLDNQLAKTKKQINSLQKKKEWLVTVQSIITIVSTIIPDNARLSHIRATKKTVELTGQTTDLSSLKKFIDSFNEANTSFHFSLSSLHLTEEKFDNNALILFVIKAIPY